jgi:hypothetical protein
MSWSHPVPAPNMSWRTGGVITSVSSAARKYQFGPFADVQLSGADLAADRSRGRRIGRSDVDQLGLQTQARPHRLEAPRGRRDHLDTSPTAAVEVALGLGVPHGGHLQQATVASTAVVLAVLERRSPAVALELTTVGVLQHGAVLATPASDGQRSAGHGAHRGPANL